MALFFLGQLLFNIFFLDLLYFLEDLDIASYADNTAIYTVKKTTKKSKQKVCYKCIRDIITATFQMIQHQLYES